MRKFRSISLSFTAWLRVRVPRRLFPPVCVSLPPFAYRFLRRVQNEVDGVLLLLLQILRERSQVSRSKHQTRGQVALHLHHLALPLGILIYRFLRVNERDNDYLNRNDVLRVLSVVLELDVEHIVLADQKLVRTVRPLHDAGIRFTNRFPTRITDLL